MGRSVSYPSGAIVAFTLLDVECDDDWEFEYEWLREDLRERAGRAFPSLIPHDGWRGREHRILMRNAYADFGVSVYSGLVAVWIVERDDGSYWDADFAAGMDPECSIRRIPMTNLVILVGRIARDPETRTTQGGTSITSVSVVTDRPARKEGKTYKDENGYTAKDSEFHRVTCFNGLGENVAKYCTKGQMVSVEGRIHYTQWEDESGTKRYGCEIIADKVDFLTKGRSGTNEDAPDIDED